MGIFARLTKERTSCFLEKIGFTPYDMTKSHCRLSSWEIRRNHPIPLTLPNPQLPRPLLPLRHRRTLYARQGRLPCGISVSLQRSAKKYANLAKQDPGRARQKRLTRAGINFLQKRTIFLADLCTQRRSGPC